MLKKKNFFLLNVVGERHFSYGVKPLFDFDKRKRISGLTKTLCSFYVEASLRQQNKLYTKLSKRCLLPTPNLRFGNELRRLTKNYVLYSEASYLCQIEDLATNKIWALLETGVAKSSIWHRPTSLDKMSFLSSDLANLGLSLKTYTFLKQKGINKIGNLLEHSPKSLLQLLNRNREMFVEVKKCFCYQVSRTF